jgi:tetratricopeptide (TPR) repeat protein
MWEEQGLSEARKSELENAALEQYVRIKQLNIRSYDHKIKLADANYKFGNLEEAEKIYDEVRMAQENHIPAWMGLGQTYMKMAKYGPAKVCFSRIIYNDDILPERIPALAYYGHALASVNMHEIDIQQVKDNLRKAISLDPALLNAAYKESRFTNTFDDLNTVLAANRSYLAGKTAEAEGDIVEANQLYETAIDRDPNNAVYHAALANTYVVLEKYPEAQDAYTRALELDRANDNYRYLLGTVYLIRGEYAQAVGAIEEAINPDNPQARHYTSLGDAYFFRNQGNDMEHAAEAYNKAIEINPEFGDTYCKLTLVYKKTNQTEMVEASYPLCMQKSNNSELIERAKPAQVEPEATPTPTTNEHVTP